MRCDEPGSGQVSPPEHFREVCECGNVLRQCRCPGPKKQVVMRPCLCKKPAQSPDTRRFRTVRAQTVELLELGMNALHEEGYTEVVRVIHADSCPEDHFFAVMARPKGPAYVVGPEAKDMKPGGVVGPVDPHFGG
jgi:hypothetical protein